jgi:mannose-6-phosphate isomerase-like protein (cupin superfamily)
MDETLHSPSAIFVTAGKDQLGEHRGLGINTIDFKVATQDAQSPLVIEMNIWEKGGPARHLHLEQEEWFYVVEGDFMMEIGEQRFDLKSGDSLLAPRNVPHVWAYVGDSRGRLVIGFFPAGKMEAFFRETTKANAMPPQDPALWRAHGMQLMGPPLSVK